jgi:hypothetical protein
VSDATTLRRTGTPSRTRRLILLVAAIAVAPVLFSYAAYYGLPRESRVNYGTLLETRPLADIRGTDAEGNVFATSKLRGRWLILFASPGACESACEDALYASRQARTMQNAERERIVRVLLVTTEQTPSQRLIAEHPDLSVVRVAPNALSALPEGATRIYLIDPLGNLVLAWPAKPDIKALANDLARLLRASRIG